MKIYFDENFSPHLVQGLKALQAGARKENIEVLSIADEFGRGAADEYWIPEVAKRHGVAITQDMNIHRMRQQWALCEQHKIGIVFVKPPKKGWNYWTIVQLIVKLWKEITEHSTRAQRPFSAEIAATTGRFKSRS